MTLLVDEKGKIAKLYGADHWLSTPFETRLSDYRSEDESHIQQRHGLNEFASRSVPNTDR